MLDPRIYRMGIVPVVLAVVVLAFSIEDQAGALHSNVVPDAFNGSHAYRTMQALASQYPDRRAGSQGDRNLARYVARRLHRDGFKNVSSDVFLGPTAHGERTLENVTGYRAGGGSGSIVIVSHRDSAGAAGLSGTAVMLELARVLAGQTLNRTLVVASTSGSDGAVGAKRLASQLAGPVDAVLVLGDLAGTRTRQPVVVPWSDGQNVAPAALRNTVSVAVGSQTGLPSEGAGLFGQLAHLAFPLSASEQAPLVAGGLPAVELSLSSARDPAPDEPTSPSRVGGMGRATLEAVSALEAGSSVGTPSTYMLWDGKVIPAWAVRLLVLVLILPVLAVTVDGMARARRRGHVISRWIGWVLAAAGPFILATILIVIARATGWIGPASSIPVNSGSWPLGAGGITLLVLTGLLIVGGLLWLRPLMIGLVGLRGRLAATGPEANGGPTPAHRRDRTGGAGHGAGAAAGVLVLMCVVAIAIWVSNPFAALLVVPALHLWLWVVTPDVRLPLPATIALILVGLAPVALLATYFALTFGVGPLGLAWDGVLLLAGGGVSVLSAIEWSLLAGCALSVVAIAWRTQAKPAQAPVTVRGPVSYAGPGSLGGTESALRR
jgi:Peptidase family M28